MPAPAPRDNALAPAGESELVVGGFADSGGGHTAKPITFDGEGHLYVQAGVPSNACQEQDRAPLSRGLSPCPQLEQYGGVWRFGATARNQDQLGDGIRYSTGHRNVVALEWNAIANQLFLVMHGRDPLPGLGDLGYDLALRELAMPADSLVQRSGGHARGEWHRDEIAITATGLDVVEGKRDGLALPLPERWVGGVRVAPNQRNWRFDERTRSVELR